jgi:polyphosphate kinase 2
MHPAVPRVGEGGGMSEQSAEQEQGGTSVGTVERLALPAAQYRVDDSDDDDPVLLKADGAPVGTWREGYPYAERLSRAEYESTKRLLQIELLKLQSWVKETGTRIVVLFEGRDAAGKGGTIKRFMEHLNPRGARVVALEKPTEREAGQWYFQRYVAHLPGEGEIVLFDRSWYNRAGVERVMGFTEPRDYMEFLRAAPELERMLVRSGIHLVKLWFSVSRTEQRTRFLIARSTPCGSGSSPPWTSPPSTAGRTTPRPRRPCSSTPTPRTRRGP